MLNDSRKTLKRLRDDMNLNNRVLIFIILLQGIINLVFSFGMVMQAWINLDIKKVLDTQDELNNEFYQILVPSPPAMSQPTGGQGV